MLASFNLDSNKDLYVVQYNSEEEWLKLRHDGIGGSDAAAIMGISKYKSPLKVYKEKLGLVHEDQSDNVFIKKGKDLEALIRDQYVVPYMYEKGYYVKHPEFMLINGTCPWLRANLDGIAVPVDTLDKDFTDNIVIEIKWVSEYAESNWFGDDYCGVPPSYYAQVQHYMTVTGASKAIICALFDKDWSMHYFEIPYDLKFALDLLKATDKFYHINIEQGVPPRLTPSLDKDEVLEAVLNPKIEYTLSEEMAQKCAVYNMLKEQSKELDRQASKIHDDIIAMYCEGNVPLNGFRVSASKRTTTRIDAKKLEEEYPDAYEACKVTSEFAMHTIRKR